MKAAGIVVEYNPFHNGHLYHINKVKELTGCDSIVAVMSGNFVQRGEPSIVNKWARTKIALKYGVDLVIEIPFIYSTSSAEGFAFGSVSLLDSLGVIDSIVFGSEAGNIDELKFISDILQSQPVSFCQSFKGHIKSGYSYPAAVQKALTDYIINEKLTNVNFNDKIILNSNNILSIEYLKALKTLKSTIMPYTIERIGSDYKDVNIKGSISSATAIRNNIKNPPLIREALPLYSYIILMDEIKKGRGPVNLMSFSRIILYKIRTSSLEELREILDINEGFEFKIKRAAEESNDVLQLIEKAKNKRFTYTRIQRILLYILFNIKRDFLYKVKSRPEYIRVLGFNKKGRELLKGIKSNSNIPVITNPSIKDKALLINDITASDIYSLAYKNGRYAVLDLKTPPVIID